MGRREKSERKCGEEPRKENVGSRDIRYHALFHLRVQDSGWGTGNMTDTAIHTLTHRRFKITSLKIDDEQHMTRVRSRRGSYLFFRAY